MHMHSAYIQEKAEVGVSQKPFRNGGYEYNWWSRPTANNICVCESV